MHRKHQRATHQWSSPEQQKNVITTAKFFQASKGRRLTRSRDWGRGREGMRRKTWEVTWSTAPEELNSQMLSFAYVVVHSSLLPFLQALGQICNNFEVSCPPNLNKDNSLSNLKRKQKSSSILACQRLTGHLPWALPNLLLSQFYFKPLSTLKVEILQERIKQQTSTSSSMKLVLSNTEEIANIQGQQTKCFQRFPR